MLFFEAATNIMLVFNMFATMARQDNRVQLQQSDMCLAFNTAKMSTGRFDILQ